MDLTLVRPGACTAGVVLKVLQVPELRHRITEQAGQAQVQQLPASKKKIVASLFTVNKWGFNSF